MPALPYSGAPASPSPIDTPTLDEINIGTTANDGTGDPLRTAFDKVNDNFALVRGGLQYCMPQAWEVTSVQTSNYTVTVGSYCIRMDTTAGNLNVTLPAASGVEGQEIEVVKWDNSANDVICVLNGSDSFFGTTGTVLTQYEVLRLRSVGTGWLKV